MKKFKEIDWRWKIKRILWCIRWPLKAGSCDALTEALIATNVVYPRRQEAWDIFFEKGNTRKSLERTLVKATDNVEERKAGRKAFWKVRKSVRQTLAAIMAFLFVIVFVCMPARIILPNSNYIADINKPLIFEGMSRVEAAAVQLLIDAGWKERQYKITVAKHAAANTTEETQAISAVPVGGQGAYSQTGVFTIQDMVDWLGSEDPAAKTIVAAFEKNGVTRAQVLDVNNWVIVTAEVAFRYRDNTAFKNGKIIHLGDREGKAGEIFFMFILPDNSGIPVRAACGNPQNDTPTPLEPEETTTHHEESTTLQMETTTVPTTRPETTTCPPETTTIVTTQPETTTCPPETTTIVTTQPETTTCPPETTTLAPKSPDPTDYKQPGDDDETDSGTGIKPVVPEVTTPADVNPPVVTVIIHWVSGVIDSITNQPGSETGGSAPGVEPTVGEATTRYIPPVETGANPTQGSTSPGQTTTQSVNTGDPGLGDF